MKGLLCKDLYDLCRPISFVIPAGLLLGGMILKSPYLLSFIAVYIGVLPLGYLQNDEISRWHIRLMTMPFTRRMIVAEKYLLSFLLTLVVLILMGCGVLVCGQPLFTNAAAAGAWLTGALMPCIVMPAIMYPLSFRFGALEGRVLLAVLLIGFAGAFSAAISFPNAEFTPGYYLMIAAIKFFPFLREKKYIIEMFNQIIAAKKLDIMLYTVAGYAVVMLLSLHISIRGFRKRSF